MTTEASSVPEFWSRPEAKVCKPRIYRHRGTWFVLWHPGAHQCCESWANALMVAARMHPVTTHMSVHCWMCHRQTHERPTRG